jgi:AmmeMemoRadiSam system protein A
MSKSATSATYSVEQRQLLLEAAHSAIGHAFDHGRAAPWIVDPSDHPEWLRQERATFVTLTIDGQLRGCIGALEAHRALISDVTGNARAAAFSDPRFQPLSPAEFARTAIEISILSPPEPLGTRERQELLTMLRPEVDGLIIESSGRRATFLPSVWKSLPQPTDFLAHLLAKAGLPGNLEKMQAWRYTTESFE